MASSRESSLFWSAVPPSLMEVQDRRPVAGSAPEDKRHFARLDNAGPAIENLHLAMQFNENYDITNWVGAGHSFTFNHEDETPDFDDVGVGPDRSNYEYHAGSSTGGDLKLVKTPNDLAESADDRRVRPARNDSRPAGQRD